MNPKINRILENGVCEFLKNTGRYPTHCFINQETLDALTGALMRVFSYKEKVTLEECRGMKIVVTENVPNLTVGLLYGCEDRETKP